MSLVIIGHYKCALHNMGDEHPEQPKRLSAINDQLISSGLEYVVQQRDAGPISIEHLYRVHDKTYIDDLYALTPGQDDNNIWLDSDTLMTEHTLTSAEYAAGAAVDAVDLLMQDKASKVFCAVRPPGHHAERDKAMGFCVFNNVAIAAAYALEHYQLQRVAIVDFDVHHGNGTEHIFAGDERVLFCSSFQHPFYPFSGNDTHCNNILNMPLDAGCGGEAFRQKVTEQWLPKLDEFKPELILVSAGFDAHREDDLGQLRFTEADYSWITTELKQLADKHCHGRILSTLEGGYALSALARSVVAHLKALMG